MSGRLCFGTVAHFITSGKQATSHPVKASPRLIVCLSILVITKTTMHYDVILHLATFNLEECDFRFNACGPLFINETVKGHGVLCDITSGLEKALADAMVAARYEVINDVKCRQAADKDLFASILECFAERFPKLKEQ